MTNFNDPSSVIMEDVSIPKRAYKVIEELAWDFGHQAVTPGKSAISFIFWAICLNVS